MAINTYDIGQLVRVTAVFTDQAGTLVDPGSITLKIQTPDSVVTTFTGGTLIRDSVGTYHFDFSITLRGDHWYKWFGTTPCQAVSETYFKVRTPEIV